MPPPPSPTLSPTLPQPSPARGEGAHFRCGSTAQKKSGALLKKHAGPNSNATNLIQDAAALGGRLRELRWKNSAWLATAETIAGWNGLEIKNAGSGRSPVRKR